MKSIKLIIVHLILTFFFFSCENSKDDKTKEEPATAEILSNDSFITAKVNGILINFSELEFYAKKEKYIGDKFLTLEIMGSFRQKEKKHSLYLTIPNYKSIGEFKIKEFDAMKKTISATYDIKTITDSSEIEDILRAIKDVWIAKEGVIEITEEKKDRIIGTFSFTTEKGHYKKKGIIHITEGKFNLPLHTYSPKYPILENLLDTFVNSIGNKE